MADRGKVIATLTACARGNITCKQSGCPYWGEEDDCIGKMARDALELLKAQEPRVMTLEEVLGGDECWFEYINGSCGYVDVYMQDNKTAIIHRTNIRPVEVPITDYMKKWRCWSYRPTDEQRKEVKWQR